MELKPKDLVVPYEQVAQAGQGLDPREHAGGELSQAAAGAWRCRDLICLAIILRAGATALASCDAVGDNAWLRQVAPLHGARPSPDCTTGYAFESRITLRLHLVRGRSASR